MIGIAILGAGTFAREDHLPAIQKSSLFDLKAIYSRSQDRADALVSQAGPGVQSYFDTPENAGRSLDDLLARDGITAVVICVPIMKQVDVVRRALAAGKHVLSEKPIAPDVATARDLIAFHAKLPSPPLWGVAENYRFVDGVAKAAEKVEELGGKLVSFRLRMTMLLEDDYKYLSSDWRRYPEHQGGMLYDGGIHLVACVRMLVSAAGEEITQLAAFTNQLQELLPPVDTVHAIMSTTGGGTGVFHLSFGAELGQAFKMEAITTNGSVLFTPMGMKVVHKASDGAQTVEEFPVTMDSGVDAEIEAFGQGIASGSIHQRQTTNEALRDILVMQAMLQSGNAKGASQIVQ